MFLNFWLKFQNLNNKILIKKILKWILGRCYSDIPERYDNVIILTQSNTKNRSVVQWNI